MAGLCQCSQGCFPLQMAVAIATVVLVLEGQGAGAQCCFGLHGHPVEEFLLVVVIEPFDHAIAPGFGGRDEPEGDAIMQAQADERPHAPGMGGTAIEGHFIIDLEMSGHPQALPNRPECCIDGVAATAEQGLRSTPAGGQVHDIHAVEAHGFCLPFEVTRSHEIGLVAVIGGHRRQGRIGGAFRLITAGTPLNQIMPTQNPVDRAQGRQRSDVLVLQLPQDRLGATELGVLVQLEARQLHLLFDRLGRSPGTRQGSS